MAAKVWEDELGLIILWAGFLKFLGSIDILNKILNFYILSMHEMELINVEYFMNQHIWLKL